MITLKDPNNPASPRLIETKHGWIECLGDDFRRWMNKPLKRVHVFTFKYVLLHFPNLDDAAYNIRLLPAYRKPAVKEWRNRVALVIKRARKTAKLELPIYDESTGEYELPQKGVV